MHFSWHTMGAEENVSSHVKVFQNGLLAHDRPARCRRQDAASARQPHQSGEGLTKPVTCVRCFDCGGGKTGV